MGFCLLFGSERRESVIKFSVKGAHFVGFIISSGAAVHISKQRFNMKKGHGGGWFKERKGKTLVLWPRMLTYWLVNRMWRQWAWLPGAYEPKSGIVGLKFTESPKRETLHMHFEYYLSEVKWVFRGRAGGPQSVFFLPRGCRAIGSTTLQCAHSFVFCSGAVAAVYNWKKNKT